MFGKTPAPARAHPAITVSAACLPGLDVCAPESPRMKRLTVTIPEEMDERLAERVERDEYESKSEAVREFIQQAGAYEDRLHEVQRDLAECEREVERLRNEKRLILEDRDERTELVTFAQQQRSLVRKQAEREEMRNQAGALTRFRWWLTGMPKIENESE